MTDGIIQKTFDKWELTDTKENEFYQDVIDSIKMELIEKIKWELPHIGLIDEIQVNHIMKYLIGDNQE